MEKVINVTLETKIIIIFGQFFSSYMTIIMEGRNCLVFSNLLLDIWNDYLYFFVLLFSFLNYWLSNNYKDFLKGK